VVVVFGGESYKMLKIYIFFSNKQFDGNYCGMFKEDVSFITLALAKQQNKLFYVFD